jgi:hypothetical protein
MQTNPAVTIAQMFQVAMSGIAVNTDKLTRLMVRYKDSNLLMAEVKVQFKGLKGSELETKLAKAFNGYLRMYVKEVFGEGKG